jgi:ion channel-forming bestrophin family protein
MITKKNLSPIKVWSYIKFQISYTILVSFLVWLTFYLTGKKEMALNFVPIGMIGSALAIFVAFRNNSAYARWWEARTLWGGIVTSSRVFGRLIITFTDSHSHQPNYNEERSNSFKREMILATIGWVHSLRLQLRNQENLDELKSYFNKEEFLSIQKNSSKPNMIQLLIGQKIYRAMANGTLGGFDSFQMEGQLLALANYQSSCERIKHTPLPRQYDFFTKIFVLVFATLLPFGLLSFFQTEVNLTISWIIIPLSVLIAGVFIIMERTGAANENPFENLVTDVPITSICNTIEIDLLEMLGEKSLPEKVKPVDGYLF